ncbi:MAG: hypothetical protein R6X33_18600 [Candidatus Brocadiia bacterium]
MRIWTMPIVAFVLAVFPATAARSEPTLDESNSWAFRPAPERKSGVALLDLRHLNEEVAGETGFVRATDDGRFVRGDGRPIRFWGVHAKSKLDWSDEEARRNARWLAGLGVNLVRHGGTLRSGEEGSAVTDVNERALREQWRTVAVMKQEGIYSMISPYWGYGGFGGPIPGSWGIEGYSGKDALHPILIFYPKLQEGYKAWLRRLLTEENPYTGIPLVEDPALAFLEVHNESNMLFYWVNSIKGEPLRVLQRQFAAWAAEKHGSVEDALQAWGSAELEGDAPQDGRLGLMNIWFMTSDGMGQAPNRRRARDTLEFYAETERSFYEGMERYVRDELGYKGLFSTSNFHSADQVLLDDLERWCKSAGDLICRNSYYGPNHRGANAGWRIEPGDFYAAESATKQPLRLPALKKQVAGLPYIITETLWVRPHPYEAEGPLMMAAYMGLNGVDSALWAGPRAVTWNEDLYMTWATFEGGHPIRKFGCAQPGTMGQFPAAALIHRRGYVTESEPVVHEERTLDGMLDLKPPMIADSADFDPNQYAERYRENPDIPGGVRPEAFLAGKVEVVLDGDPSRSRVMDVSEYVRGGSIRSATGELRVDRERGLFTLDTPKAQAAAGFLKGAGAVRLGEVTIECANEHAAVTVVSLDDDPLATSGKVLVQVGTLSRPTGWKTEPQVYRTENGRGIEGVRIVSTGRMPWRVKNGRVRLTIANDGLSRGIALDESGYEDRAVPVVRSGQGLTIEFPRDAIHVILQ